MKKDLKKSKSEGITLVALIVTIIILLILAGVTIVQLTGNGLFEKAKLAEDKSTEAQNLENQILSDYDTKINEYVSGNREAGSESQLIRGIGFEAIDISYNKIKFKITIDSDNSGDAVVYYMFCNGKVVTGGTTDEILIENLDSNTKYTFKCGVIDINGDFKISEEKEFQTTDKLVLYENGYLNSDIAGSLTSSGNGNQKVQLNTDNIYFYNTATSSYSNKIFWFNKKLDLSDFKTITIDWKTTERKMCIAGITSNTPSFTNATSDDSGKTQFASYIIGNTSTDNVTQEIDISNINEGYLAFYIYDVKSYIYGITLAK